MNNLLIILGVLAVALFVIIPLVEKNAKPVTPEQMASYQKWFMVLFSIMLVAMVVRTCTSG